MTATSSGYIECFHNNTELCYEFCVEVGAIEQLIRDYVDSSKNLTPLLIRSLEREDHLLISGHLLQYSVIYFSLDDLENTNE